MIELSEQETIGLKLIALARDGQLDMFKCSACSDEMAETRFCDGGDNDSPIFYHHDIGEFYACPLRFIPQTIYMFMDRYDYIKTHESTAPNYDDVNPRYWEAEKFYNNYVYNLEKDKIDGNKPKEENLSKMASLFKKE